MSNERDKEFMDELVSKTYQELPTPPAPDRLNERILRMAARQSKVRNKFSFAAWMKPVTWAATVAISLTIVLELSELPTISGQMDDAAAINSTGKSIADEFAPQDRVSLEQAENRARSQTVPDRTPLRENESSVPAEGYPEELVIEDKGKTDSFAAAAPAAATPVARQRADEPVASLALSVEKKESDADAACDMKIRESSDDWLECIENLRESGAVELADREYAAFMRAYPAETANPEANK